MISKVVACLALFIGCAVGEVRIQNGLLKVTSQSGDTITAEKLDFPSPLAKTIKVGETDKLTITFSIDEPVDQVDIRMTSPTVDRIKTVKTTKGDGKYTAAMDFSSKRGPKVEAGTYTIDVLVGGLMIEKPLTWTVGKADIASTFVRQSATGVHRLEPLEYTFTPGFEVPSSFMGTVFSAAVVAPAVILLGAWAGLGVNLKQFNPSLAALVFHSSLVAMYALFIWFWVELNMYTTIWYFLPIGVVMFLSGHRALSQLEMA